jgi:hypothetical protein
VYIVRRTIFGNRLDKTATRLENLELYVDQVCAEQRRLRFIVYGLIGLDVLVIIAGALFTSLR